MKRVVGLFIVLAITTMLFAGPFGLEMGWSKDDCIKNGVKIDKEVSSKGDNIISYNCIPPKTHPAFTYYIIRIDSQKGVYDITALSDIINSSDFGTEIQSEYKQIRDQITIIYGKSTEYDFLKAGSIWEDNNDWMMGLYKNERILLSYWKPCKDGVDIVLLNAVGVSSTSGMLNICYQSSDTNEIINRANKTAASVF